MKKIISVLISAVMVMSIFSSLPAGVFAASKKVSLKKTSATLKITKKKGKTTFGSAKIKVKKAKGVRIAKITYNSKNAKIAKVTKKGKVKAVSAGKTKVIVKVKFSFKKKLYSKALKYKVTVTDSRIKKVIPAQPVSVPATDATEQIVTTESAQTATYETAETKEGDTTEPQTTAQPTYTTEAQIATDPSEDNTTEYNPETTETNWQDNPYDTGHCVVDSSSVPEESETDWRDNPYDTGHCVVDPSSIPESATTYPPTPVPTMTAPISFLPTYNPGETATAPISYLPTYNPGETATAPISYLPTYNPDDTGHCVIDPSSIPDESETSWQDNPYDTGHCVIDPSSIPDESETNWWDNPYDTGHCVIDPSSIPDESETSWQDNPYDTGHCVIDPSTYTEETVAAKSRALNAVNEPSDLYEITDEEFREKLSKLSNKLYDLSAAKENGNFVMSPVSVYMALTMLYEIGDSDVKADIESFLEMNSTDIAKTGKLFRELAKDGINTKLSLTNSVWLNQGQNYDETTLKKLADDLYCYAYEAPFGEDNQAANQAIRDFIKDRTNGLIDRDFGLDENTLLTLINTLYFKDLWDTESSDGLSVSQREFKTANGNKSCEFLTGEYIYGQVMSVNNADYFYTETKSGCKVKFILPKEGYTLKDVMKKDTLTAINKTTDYKVVDDNDRYHMTRCIFPTFKIESEAKLTEALKENKLLTKAFAPFMSPIVNNSTLYPAGIIHNATVKFDKYGIEGAAVTIEPMAGAGCVDYFHDFVLDREFGFIITDENDVILFEGQVTNP